jgi:hypothetical protein
VQPTTATATATAAVAALLAGALGCGGKPPPALVPALVVQPAEARLLAGEATVIVARLDGDCAGPLTLSVKGADGSAPPAWLDLKADRFTTGQAPIANPGTSSPFAGGGSDFGLPAVPGGRTFSHAWNGFQLVISAAAAAPAAPVALRVRVDACGLSLDAPLTLTVAGSVELGAFCGWTPGQACGTDAGCTRGGWDGQVCLAAGAGDTLATPPLSCSDPIPSGARCGCVSGVCAWR